MPPRARPRCRRTCKPRWTRRRGAAFFATLTGANRYAILYRVGTAKRPDTRSRRIAQFVSMLERGETVHGS